MNGKHQRILAIFILTVGLIAPVVAAADPSSRAVVQLAGRDNREAAKRVSEAVDIQLQGNGAHLVVKWVDGLDQMDSGHGSLPAHVSEDTNALLVFWCDFSIDNEPAVFLTEYDNGQLLTRNMTVDQVGDEGQFEAIAVMISSAVEALELRSELKPVAPKSGPAMLTSSVTRQPQKPISGQLGVGYALRGYSSEQSLNHAAGVSVGLRFFEHWITALGYSYRYVGMDSRSTDLSSNIHDLRLSGAYEWSYKRFSLAGQVGGVLGIADWKSRFRFRKFSLDAGNTDLNFGLEAIIRVGWRITPWLRMDTGPGVTYWAVNHNYYRKVPHFFDGDSDGNDHPSWDEGRPKRDKHHPDWDDEYWDRPDSTKNQTLLSPWNLQPFWMVELSVVIN